MGNGTLQRTFEPADFRVSFRKMLLADATVHPLSPKVEATSFQFAPHQLNHFCLSDVELYFDGFKGRSILPSHFNNSIFSY